MDNEQARKRLEHIVSFSGGKDSTAMLIRLHKEAYPIDEIIYVDCGSWEFPEIRLHIDQVEKIIDRKITRLQIKPSLDWYMFEHVPSNPKNKMRIWEREGVKGLAWPTPRIRWCNNLKVRTMNRYATADFTYIGINAEERYRLGRWKQRGTVRLYPLIMWGMTGKECLNYCRYHGLDWGGLYNRFDNTSCFCCPLKSLGALRNLRKFYPALWSRLLEMDSRTWNTFRIGHTSAKSLDERFAQEEAGTWCFPKKSRGFNTKESRESKMAAIYRMTAQSLLRRKPRSLTHRKSTSGWKS